MLTGIWSTKFETHSDDAVQLYKDLLIFSRTLRLLCNSSAKSEAILPNDLSIVWSNLLKANVQQFYLFKETKSHFKCFASSLNSTFFLSFTCTQIGAQTIFSYAVHHRFKEFTLFWKLFVFFLYCALIHM